jgi:SAM-dependent methyltransferase
MSDLDHDELILEHYRKQAEAHQLAPVSTMADETTRDLEISAILSCVRYAVGALEAVSSLLEVGCGNGYLLETIRREHPGLALSGGDYSPDMLALAASRGIANCDVRQEDVRKLSFDSGAFDVVVTERCLINVLDPEAQAVGVAELFRVLKPGGFAVLIEAFTDGLDNLNRARAELGLAHNEAPYHNLWFEKERFLSLLEGRFRDVTGRDESNLPPRNFLSSHYFVSRVLYPSVTQREILYNTEFVKFFRFLAPQGEYSPIQLFFLQKVSDADAASPNW